MQPPEKWRPEWKLKFPPSDLHNHLTTALKDEPREDLWKQVHPQVEDNIWEACWDFLDERIVSVRRETWLIVHAPIRASIDTLLDDMIE